MHILAVIILRQHRYCVYKVKRKLKLLITCEKLCTFFALIVVILLCKYFFFKNVEKKSLLLGGFGEGQSGYSKHNFFFSPDIYSCEFGYCVTLFHLSVNVLFVS